MTDERMQFTDVVRQEIARQPLGRLDNARAELAGIVRVAGTLTLTPGSTRVQLDMQSGSGAVARRTHALIERCLESRPELLVRAPARGRGSSTFRVRVSSAGRKPAEVLGLVDATGRLLDGSVDALADAAPTAWLRGAFLAGGSVSHPGRPPHLELVFTDAVVAQAAATRIRILTNVRAHVVADRARARRSRVVLKSGAVIGDLLVRFGAAQAFLAWDDRRLRHQLRADATRLANADTANLRRSIDASARQVRTVERAVATVGWDAFDEDLRDVALARLANPALSLAELGELLDPPVGKSTVRRRLDRIAALAGPPPAS
ncbi:MAG: DNA-binding protein WhiA [Nitriliruptoraceae bacterium]